MFCPACGKEAPELTNFCQYCGQTLNWAAGGPQIQGTAGRSPAAVKYAGFWLRFVALVLDGIFIFIVVLGAATVVKFILGVPIGPGAGRYGVKGLGGAHAIILFIFILVPWLYWALMESSPQQATLGKMALGLKVTDLQGEPISFGKATGRFFGKFVSELILYVGFMMAGWTEKKQALHDIMAGTLVVKKQSLPEKLAKAPEFQQ
ncbi:MAG: RDD family protein, partial [Desulfobaccales bacterium]